MNNTKAIVCALTASGFMLGGAQASEISCGEYYSVVKGDTLSRISLQTYGSLVYQPIYTANVDTIGANPDRIYIGQSLMIPCLSADGSVMAMSDAAGVVGQLVFTFNKASAPPFIINSGIVDAYLEEITEVTDGRVTFVDPEVVNRVHGEQYELVTSGAVDGAYVLNSTIADTHPLLQLTMLPMFGGSAEQTAVSMWRLHETHLAQTEYFSDAQMLGFIAAPAAHIWRETSEPVVVGENVGEKNAYHVPYFDGLDTRGPAAMRAEYAALNASFGDEVPTYFMAHGAALAIGLWNEEASVSVMEVDNGLYTPTFSVILSNEAWAQISAEDQQAIREVSGEALAHRSSAWDGFDNAFRSRMLNLGLDYTKADKALLNDLWLSSMDGLKVWMDSADARGIDSTAALNSYITSLRSLEELLIYRGEETYVDQHPFVTGGS